MRESICFIFDSQWHNTGKRIAGTMRSPGRSVRDIQEETMKITFMGAGSTIFARNVIGDCMCSEVLSDSEFALYDIDGVRLEESRVILEAMKKQLGAKGVIRCYLGVENRKEALRGAAFVVNAIQVGLYEPCTVIDFEVPKKYGLRQTIGDTLGIGGIMRGLRTIPVLEDFAKDMEEVCPDALFLNYTNPMAMLSGYLQNYTGIATVGLCHSVQIASLRLFEQLGMEEYLPERKELIAGINHMAWLLAITDRNGNDLYPEITKRIPDRMADPDFKNKVRLDYVRRFGYYCTESSEHNAEYNMFYIKRNYPELIGRYNIPLDEYPRRCIRQIEEWKDMYQELQSADAKPHTRSREYASYICEAIVTGTPYQFGGNVRNANEDALDPEALRNITWKDLNGRRVGNVLPAGETDAKRLITNLPDDACVEVPCIADKKGIHPVKCGRLPVQCAAMNMTNVNVQLLTMEAARTRRKEYIYQAAMLDPHTGSELDPDTIVRMCDELIEAHGPYMEMYR